MQKKCFSLSKEMFQSFNGNVLKIKRNIFKQSISTLAIYYLNRSLSLTSVILMHKHCIFNTKTKKNISFYNIFLQTKD